MGEYKRGIRKDSENIPFIKIVIYGPGQSGKTSLLQLYSMLKQVANPGEVVSKVTKIQNPIKETAFFDQTIFALGKKSVEVEKDGEMITIEVPLVKYGIYTVAGSEKYKETREIVVKGVDGVILLLDYEKSRITENANSVNELISFMGLDVLKRTPFVIMGNKTDLPVKDKSSSDDLLSIFTDLGVAETTGDLAPKMFNISLLQAKNELLDLIKSDKSSNLLSDKGFFREDIIPASSRDIVTTIRLLTSTTIRTLMK